MNLYKSATRLALASGLSLALASSAAAATIGVSPTPVIGPLSAGSYVWSYDVGHTGDSTINTGDFFTIFDFAGFVAGSQSVVAGWSATSANVGSCPADLPVLCGLIDDAAVPNLTWTRTGAPINHVGDSVTLLGEFSARSIYNQVRNDWWASQDQDNQTTPVTPNEGAAGNTNVPFATPQVPEPASMLLLGMGLLGAGIARRRR